MGPVAPYLPEVMAMKKCVIALALASLLVGVASAARFKTPKPFPGEDEFFVLKPTWVETLLASREALARVEAEHDKQMEEFRLGDPVLKSFRPVRMEVAETSAPAELKLRVAGLKDVHLGVKGETYVVLGDLRVVDRDGKVNPVAYDQPKRYIHGTRQNWDHDDRGQKGPFKLGDRSFARWFKTREGEMSLRLDEGSEFLLATVGTDPRKDRKPSVLYVDHRSKQERDQKPKEAREAVWRRTMESFTGPNVLRQIHLEESIWKEDWKDLAELAGRYARECEGETRKTAEQRAGACKSIADLLAVRDLFYVKPIQARLELGRRTLEFVQRSAARPELAAELDKLDRSYAELRQGRGSGEELYQAACELRRRIILSHPQLGFDRLLVNKRTGFLPEHMCDQYLGRHSQQGEGLVILDDWKTAPRETPLLSDVLPKAGVLHPDLSYDGKRVLFAAVDHSLERGRNRNLKGYFVYELDLQTRKLRQITGTSADPMEGRDGRQTVLIEDMDPCYLPDGGIAFISTRSQQYGRCHGGRYVPSYTLYRCEPDGTHIRALSFNESNEWGPAVLHDGSIVYTRWDYVNRHDVKFQSLWLIHPDGTQTAHYYGNNSPAPCLIGETQPIPGCAKSVATAAAHHGQTLGTIIVIDPDAGQDHGRPLKWVTPELGFPESGVPDGIVRATEPLREDRAGGGRAATPWPINEDLFLCTYQHGKQYAIYLVDTLGGRELIHSARNISCFDPIPLRPRPCPPALVSSIAGRESEKTGVFVIEDVYQSQQPIPRGSVKEMRINQILPQPTSSAPVRSAADNEIVKKILGTVPVEPDGSVAFEAPAGRPFQLQLLDANGMALMTMRSLVYLQPGEQASCVGCHEPRNSTPPSRPPANPKIRQITPPIAQDYAGGFSFAGTVQPVLDRYCVGCHSGDKAPRNISLVGDYRDAELWTKRGKNRKRSWTLSYESLLAAGVLRVAPRNGESYPSKPMDYFAHAGKLAKMLLAGHPDKEGKKRVELDRASLRRIIDWLDVNAQFYGDYSFNRVSDLPPVQAGVEALRKAVRERFGDELADQPLALLVNVVNVDESRILMAPLSVQAGGWGQVQRGAYKDRNDPAYAQMRKLVEGVIPQPQAHEIAGTCGRDNGCRCGTCWVRKEGAARPIPPAEPAKTVAGK